jgi:hypothetical protein
MIVICESLRESSVWRVGQVFPYRVYIDLSRHNTLGYEWQLVVTAIL